MAIPTLVFHLEKNWGVILMFTSNPFAELAVFLPPFVMQVYIVLMIVAVAAGTLVDRLHKGSTKI